MSYKFVLGQEAAAEGRRSLEGLSGHVASSKGAGHRDAVFVVINTHIQIIKSKDYTPRVIPVTHGLDKITNRAILLVTRDPSTPYRLALAAKGSATEDTFSQIISLTKLKLLARDKAKLYRLFKETDIVVADPRIHKLLPAVLGAQFYQKNKKVPFMVQMAKPDHRLVPPPGPKKRVKPVVDERCDVAYVKGQVRLIVRNPYFIPPVNGTCISIKVGYSDWPADELLRNVHDVLLYLVEPQYLPVGGLLKSVKNIHSVHVKTGESMSLPVLLKAEEREAEDEDSDFDF